MREMCRNFICSTNNSPAVSPQFPDNSSSCVLSHVGPAQAYVPSQPYTTPVEQEQSLVCGTVFSDLVMPYCAGWNVYRFQKEV